MSREEKLIELQKQLREAVLELEVATNKFDNCPHDDWALIDIIIKEINLIRARIDLIRLRGTLL